MACSNFQVVNVQEIDISESTIEINGRIFYLQKPWWRWPMDGRIRRVPREFRHTRTDLRSAVFHSGNRYTTLRSGTDTPSNFDKPKVGNRLSIKAKDRITFPAKTRFHFEQSIPIMSQKLVYELPHFQSQLFQKYQTNERSNLPMSFTSLSLIYSRIPRQEIQIKRECTSTC